MCECGQSNCRANIEISLREYEAVRLHPTRFLIKEGHEVADVVRVVGSGTAYVVVAKFDADASSAGDVRGSNQPPPTRVSAPKQTTLTDADGEAPTQIATASPRFNEPIRPPHKKRVSK